MHNKQKISNRKHGANSLQERQLIPYLTNMKTPTVAWFKKSHTWRAKRAGMRSVH